MKAFHGLIEQCIKRDSAWKEWYVEQMDGMKSKGKPTRDDLLHIFTVEMSAERDFQDGNPDSATGAIQSLLDSHSLPDSDRGWYLQEIARYSYPTSKARSNELQRNAHKTNRALLRPKEGMFFIKVQTLTPEKRLERIRGWLTSHELFENVATHIEDMLTNLTFGVVADHFEQAMQDLATALGFESDRPDREWKEGPDNLWGLREDQYLLFECKSEVELTRAEINKRETDQMNRSSAWFKRYYPGSAVTRVMIIPTHTLASGAALNEEVVIMGKKQLDQLSKNVRGFFNEFRTTDLRDLSESKIQSHLRTHNLTVDDLTTAYVRKPVAYRSP